MNGKTTLLNLKSEFGNRTALGTFVESYGYDNTAINKTSDYYTQNYDRRWVVLKYVMSLNDSLLYKNSIFCETLVGSFLVGKIQDSHYDNSDNPYLWFNCEIKINLKTLKSYPNPNNKSVQFPSTFIISAFNQFSGGSGAFYPDAIYY